MLLFIIFLIILFLLIVIIYNTFSNHTDNKNDCDCEDY